MSKKTTSAVQATPGDKLRAARELAYGLFQAAAGPLQDKTAAQALLELALLTTSLVDDLLRALNPAGIREASKHYEGFPILASGVRRANAFQLESVMALPLGEHRPFKSDATVGPATRWDNLRDTIVRCVYPEFDRLRQGSRATDISPSLAKKIKNLPAISQASRRDWANLMAESLYHSPGGKELLPMLTNPSRGKKRGIRKKRKTLEKKYEGRELDCIEKTWLQEKSKALKSAAVRPSTESEEILTLVDAIDDRLKGMLKR